MQMEETQEIDIPREELVKGAKILKQWADSIGVKVFSTADFLELLVVVSTELEYEEEIRGKYGMEILLHSYIHSRFEYLCKILSFIMHVSQALSLGGSFREYYHRDFFLRTDESSVARHTSQECIAIHVQNLQGFIAAGRTSGIGRGGRLVFRHIHRRLQTQHHQ